jgi:hypothetical protein
MIQPTKNRKSDGDKPRRSDDRSKSGGRKRKTKSYSSMIRKINKEKRVIKRSSIATNRKGYGDETSPTEDIRSKMQSMRDCRYGNKCSSDGECNKWRKIDGGGWNNLKQSKMNS